MTEGSTPSWAVQDRLREAHRSGASLAAVLRAEQASGKLWLTRHLLEAFDVRIGPATALAAVAALDSQDDSQVDARLKAALPARSTVASD